MVSGSQFIAPDVLRHSGLYKWLQGRTAAHRIRDFLRFCRLYSPAQALRFSRRLWSEEGQVVEVTPPKYQHPVNLRSFSSDSRVFHEIFGREIYGFELPAEASFIIDAGANIGLASVYFAHHYPNAKIVSVEPSHENISLLAKNVSPYPGVSYIEAGLWYKKEALRFLNPTGDSWAFRVEPCPEGEAAFPTITLREIMDAHHAERIDILKMDIEGTERHLLFDSDASWLDWVDLFIVELHSDLARENFSRVVELLKTRGLRLVRGGENCFFRRDPSGGKSSPGN